MTDKMVLTRIEEIDEHLTKLKDEEKQLRIERLALSASVMRPGIEVFEDRIEFTSQKTVDQVKGFVQGGGSVNLRRTDLVGKKCHFLYYTNIATIVFNATPYGDEFGNVAVECSGRGIYINNNFRIKLAEHAPPHCEDPDIIYFVHIE